MLVVDIGYDILLTFALQYLTRTISGTSSSSGFGAEGVNFNASASNSETYFWDLCLKDGFIEIQPGQYQQFQIKADGEADNLYVFVMRKVNGKCELKVGGLPI